MAATDPDKETASSINTGSDTLIDVEDFLRQHSVEDLCATAEDYFSRLDGEELIVHEARKPFANLLEAPQSLHKLGHLLGGLRLGQGMTVMDFGAGLGWLSRHLNQLGCETVSVDVSATALRLGEQAFERHYVGERQAPAHFVPYDGHRVDWSDDSVDRVICFDAFHHIPNQREALAEMQRVLRPGGIAGFAEPGRKHSRTAPAQMEMARLATLENDIRLEDIFGLAREVGFTDLACTQGIPQPTLFALDEYLAIVAPETAIGRLERWRSWWRRHVWPGHIWPGHVWPSRTELKIRTMVQQGMTDGPVFFLHNGPFTPDSRSPEGLGHRIELGAVPARVAVGQALDLEITVTNTGTARWLNHSRNDFGAVRLGVQLVSGESSNDDFARQPLGSDVAPGESLDLRVSVSLPQGRHRLRLDLVAEHVAWFERLGSPVPEFEIDVA
ncbi:MAG: class I SAM-dependent methyltransferase [Acidobacteriota bacterium]